MIVNSQEQAKPNSEKRTLTVFWHGGLGNRLRVLLSGLALAEASGRKFTMLWPLTLACAAPFADLFSNDWPVNTVEADAVADLPFILKPTDVPDLLTAAEPNLILGYARWLIRPGHFPMHQLLWERCETSFANLRPTPPIQQQVDTFRQQHFRPAMIGVHLRRGDFLLRRGRVADNTVQAFAAVDRFLDTSPDAGILLCTDDGAPDPQSGLPTPYANVRKIFTQRYGEQVVSPLPSCLDRGSSLAIQEALAEIYLLRACDAFVGTANSSFSEMVLFGQKTPHVLATGTTAAPPLFPGSSRLPVQWLRKFFAGLHARANGRTSL